MSNIEVTDELLYKYVPVLEEAMMNELEKEVDYNYQFSKKFEKKMKRIMWKESHMWIGDFFRFLKKTAIVFLCISCVAFALAMSVKANRIKFFKTVEEIWTDSILRTYFRDSEPESIRYMEPHYLPDGYTETQRTETEHMLDIIYENENEKGITWMQHLVTEGTHYVQDSEYDEIIYLETDMGLLTVYAYEDGFKMVYLESEDYFYVCGGNMSVEEVVNIFNSVK